MATQIIYKFPISLSGPTEIELPCAQFVKFLRAGYDPNNELCAWAIVEPDADGHRSKRVDYATVHVYGTGQEIIDGDEAGLVYMNSIVDGYYVWHFFAELDSRDE